MVAVLAAQLGDPRSFAETETWSLGRVTLPSGRDLDLGRSRWDGVLDGEEFEYCRHHGIPLAYDCAQYGWVTQTCRDDSSAEATFRKRPGLDAPVALADPEQQAAELRRLLQAEAAQIGADVRGERLSLDLMQDRLATTAATALGAFANEHGLATADLCHWALQSSVADALGDVRGPLHATPPEAERTAFGFRPWVASDAPRYLDLLGNPRIWEFLPEPFPSPFTLDTARTLIEVAAIGFHHETVAIELDGRPIGQCLLRFDRPFAGVRASEVAYWLGEEHWGKGLMSRVLPVFTSRSFRRHSVDVIYAWISTGNRASIRAAERAGYQRDRFAFEAEIAESLRRPGFVRYATYRADWRADDAS